MKYSNILRILEKKNSNILRKQKTTNFTDIFVLWQKFEAYDSKGDVVAGDKSKEVMLTYFIFISDAVKF